MNTKSIAQTVADQARAKMTTAQIIDTIATLDARNCEQDSDMSIRAALYIALADELGEIVHEADDASYDNDTAFVDELRKAMAA
jgi:hypothetical protein